MEDIQSLDDAESLCSEDQSVTDVSRSQLSDGREVLKILGASAAFSSTLLSTLTRSPNLAVEYGAHTADGTVQPWAKVVDASNPRYGASVSTDRERAVEQDVNATEMPSSRDFGPASDDQHTVGLDFADVGPSSGPAAGEFADFRPGDDGFGPGRSDTADENETE